MALAEVLIRLGDPDAAAEACTRAASLRPETAGNCWLRLGNLFTKEGLHPRAADAFAKAALAEPESPRHLLRLAASYAARGLEEPAADALRRAEALIGDKTASAET
jgi:tetratricopeptide (TPR) repeat protein